MVGPLQRRCLPALALAIATGVLPAQDDATVRRRTLCDDLAAVAARELQDKRIPGIWLGVLDVDAATGVEWSWSTALGIRRHGGSDRADVGDVHRVASIGKLVTATVAVAMAARGQVELDAPVQRYLPEFTLRDPRAREVTLRHLLQHRSGLPRNGPVGHWLDAAAPDLAATVRGLAEVGLAFAPGTATAYSNPGYAVLGFALARAAGRPFAALAQELVLGPLGLRQSAFAPRPDLAARASLGRMWTLDGRDIATPEYEFGCAPALALRSTVGDLLMFARSWFPGAAARVLPAAAQAAMWKPADDVGIGLGFFVGDLDGARLVEHAGTAPGTASELAALPDDGLAACAVVDLDFANAIASELVHRALRGLVAARAGRSLPRPEWPVPLGAALARSVAGRYRAQDEWFDLRERGGDLLFDPCIGLATIQRRAGAAWLADDPCACGGRSIRRTGEGRMSDGFAEFVADAATLVPPPPPAELLPLLGEYGWDHGGAIVYEDGGRLGVLLDWHVREQPVRIAADVYECPPGAYGGERLEFVRDAAGAVAALRLGAMLLPRRPEPPVGGFRIAPLRPIGELRRAAAAASPPPQPPGLRASDLVPLASLSPTLRFDVRYATAANFLGTAVYERAAPMLQRPAAAALLAVHEELAALGYGLLVFDAYRPWSVTKVFWDATPPALRQFVADPAHGSRHNRGCAVDVSLYDLATGEPVAMPSDFDEFTPRAYPDWPGGTARQRWHRELLRTAMERHGFAVYEHEWWHFDFADWREYPVLDQPLR